MENQQWSVKYRPRSLKTFIASEAVKRGAEAIISGKSPSHAILITGMTGTGKTTLARIIAYGAAGEEYGRNTSDISEYNIANSRGIDDIRGIIESSKFKPMGNKRVIILDEVHSLTATSASPLLKPLEDCPSHLLWLLCTDQPEKLLPTIINRCLPLSLSIPSPEELQKLLLRVMKKEGVFQKEKLVSQKKLVKAIMAAAGYIPRASLQLLQSAAAEKGKISDIMRGSLLNSPAAGLDMVACKLILQAIRAYDRGKPNLKGMVKTVSDFEAIPLLLRVITLLENAIKQEVSGNRYNAAYPLVLASRETGIALDAEAMLKFLQYMVKAKQETGDFSVSVSVLLLTQISLFNEALAE